METATWYAKTRRCLLLPFISFLCQDRLGTNIVLRKVSKNGGVAFLQAMNGNDAIELFYLQPSDSVHHLVDVYGDINQDGTGTAWEYKDAFAYRSGEKRPFVSSQHCLVKNDRLPRQARDKRQETLC